MWKFGECHFIAVRPRVALHALGWGHTLQGRRGSFLGSLISFSRAALSSHGLLQGHELARGTGCLVQVALTLWTVVLEVWCWIVTDHLLVDLR